MRWNTKEAIAEIAGAVITVSLAAIPGASPFLAPVTGAGVKGIIKGIGKKNKTPQQALNEP